VSEGDHQLPEPTAHRFSWKGVEEQVAAGLILLAAGGIGFMVWTLPRQLDLVLRNQQIITERAAVMENRLGKVEDNIVILDRRTTRLEAGR
jgi:hypothetical protein